MQLFTLLSAHILVTLLVFSFGYTLPRALSLNIKSKVMNVTTQEDNLVISECWEVGHLWTTGADDKRSQQNSNIKRNFETVSIEQW